ncbi:acyl-CoA dehydrogenase [Auritidibacter ignavus]|uniref:acyl-CoA dehydrogenase family protein n=1 Tax=Auritidibacter ignavus TaxID=678932 RepID=UPI00244B6EC9|nr:acyl-CoA dehydrogenase [Auritidibacter ignavus]WGH91308.1 acyl-CoA dehydrogenase [Auritidibacter ignavus]
MGITPFPADDEKLTIDSDELQKATLGRWSDAHLWMRKEAESADLHHPIDLTLAEHRARNLEQLKLLTERNLISKAFPKRFGGEDDHGGNVAGFSELVHAHPSLQIKAGVQWGLFGAAILHLGTEKHHEKWLEDVISLELPGIYAMTEIGHGSDVDKVATTATYIPEDGEFEIHTPFKAAWKDYLGNAALHGKAAVVFAQLITKGVNHGVHAFFVPVRDEQGNFLPGVGGEDDGYKGGLNGVDNGRLHFDHVRIPRFNLLNRYGDVDEDGTYTSDIDSPGRRFFTMLSTLVQGRVSLSVSSSLASAVGLTGAITYANQRRQFNASSDIDEEFILDYQLHQRRLLDRLARTYADMFVSNDLLEKFNEVFSAEDDSDQNRQELETFAAAIKPTTTWNALDTLQECREACGGAGFLAKNRFTQLRADLDIYTTFEGDNNVLLQLVGRRLLTDYSKEFAGQSAGTVGRYLVEQANEAVYQRSGLRRVAQQVVDLGSDIRAGEWLKNEEVQHELLADRVRTRIASVASALRSVAKKSQAEQAAVYNQNQYEVIQAAKCHAELLRWESFTKVVHNTKDDDTRTILTWLRNLFTFSAIENDLGWFIENGRISQHRSRVLREYNNRLVARLRPYAQQLVDAFGFSQENLRMDITSGVEQQRQDEAAEYYRAQRASGDAPIHEKVLRRRAKQAAKQQKNG